MQHTGITGSQGVYVTFQINWPILVVRLDFLSIDIFVDIIDILSVPAPSKLYVNELSKKQY